MQRIIMHVDLDAFYASVEELRKPEIRGKPVVVCMFSGRSEDSGAVSAASYEARKLGIRSGMPIALAKRIAKDRDVVFLPTDIEHYRSVSGRVMELLEERADRFQQVSVDEAYLDVTQAASGSWEKAERFAAEIKQRLMVQESLTCSIGIGPNKLVAKMASKEKKPDGLTVVRPGEVSGFLAGKPAGKLHGIGPKTEGALEKLGIKTAGDLASADVASLEKTFGKNKASLLADTASGIDESPVEPQEAKQVSRLGTLKEDTDDAEKVMEKLTELSAGLDEKIRKKGVSFRTVSVILVDGRLGMQTRSGTAEATRDIGSVLPLVRKLVDKFIGENGGILIRRVGIRVSGFSEKKLQKKLGEF